MNDQIAHLRSEAEREFGNILSYWTRHTIDSKRGGFYGKIDNNNKVYPDASKGAVLNARILWTFSAANNFEPNELHKDVAARAFNYIINNFIDAEFGGVYWSLHADGRPLETKKQIYACAFVIYALSEYSRSTGDETAKQHAITICNTVLKYGYDTAHGGFFEAFTRQWRAMDDQRLSAKDVNEKKTTNTNLHVLEAFTNLYLIWPDGTLRSHIIELLGIFDSKIIDKRTHYLHLFFDDEWKSRPDVISYGHDIEAAWLLLRCAEAVKDQHLISVFKKISVEMAHAAIKGIDKDGGLWYEFNLSQNKMIYEKHWWPQAEAVVGFLNAWEVSGDIGFLNTALKSWKYISEYMLNPHGEWYWGRRADGSVMDEDKVGVWKCPYHNGRMCLEVLRRIA